LKAVQFVIQTLTYINIRNAINTRHRETDNGTNLGHIAAFLYDSERIIKWPRCKLKPFKSQSSN